MLRDRAALERIYPALVHHAVMSFGAEQVLRFMGRPAGAHLGDEVKTDRRRGPDGVRVKHWLNDNSLEFYDQGKRAPGRRNDQRVVRIDTDGKDRSKRRHPCASV